LPLALALASAGCGGGPRGPVGQPLPPPQPGAAVQGISLARLGGGEPIALGAFAGRVIVVHFFATWSLASQADVPMLKRLHVAYGDRVQVIGIVLDPPETAQLVTPFVEVLAIDYPVGFATAEIRRGVSPFGRIDTVPTTALVDRRGQVRSAAVGPLDADQLSRALKSLL
jgi:thiol-disulfide isomerase/thioredoxin